MKKILIALLVLLMVSGCSSQKSSTQLTDGDEVIFESETTKYTKEELYESMKASASDSLESIVFNEIAKTYDIDIDSIREEAEYYASIYISMGYESYLVYYYGSVQAYIDSIVDNYLIESIYA